MKRALVVAGVVGVAAVLWSKRRMTPETPRDERARWRVVTIQRSEADVIGAMAPLSELDAGIETRLAPAPGNRGTELAARIIDGETEPDALRIALRQTKQLAEAGEIAVVDAVHGPRKATPQGALLDFVAKKSEAKGVL